MTGISMPLAARFIPRSLTPPSPRRVDIMGGVLFAPGIAGLLLTVSASKMLEGFSFIVPVSGVGGVALLCLWWMHEWKHPDPLIEIRLLSEREGLLGNLVMACLAVGSFQATLLMALLIQQPVTAGGLGANATMVGIVKSPAMIAGLVASVTAGWACGRWGPRLPILLGSAVAAVALCLALLLRSSLVEVGVIVLLINCGVLAAYAGIPNVILAAMPEGRTGEATGIMTVFRFVFSGAGSQLLMVLLAVDKTSSPDGVAYPSSHAFSLGIAYMALTSTIATFLAFRLNRQPLESEMVRSSAVVEPS
jgi:hypothetical protein